jgi:hypothetical protein
VCEGETEEGYFDAARAHFNLTTKCKDVIDRIRREYLDDYEKADNEITKN